MTETLANPAEREARFNRERVKEYLKYGSVDEVYRMNNYDLPISYPGFHRLLDKWGVVKSAGPNSLLSEAIAFMMLLSDRQVPLESLYRRLPDKFKTSMSTMHRILHNVKEGIVRRVGTAVVVTVEGSPGKILVGDDVSTPRIEYGKPFGSLSVPMTFSKQDEDPRLAILRVLQQEAFSEEVVNKTFPYHLIPQKPKPFMHFDVADIRVSVFSLTVKADQLKKYPPSSDKLENLHFVLLSELAIHDRETNHIRAGMREIALGYQNYLAGKAEAFNPGKAHLNVELAGLAPAYLGSE
jgi:hypothetical protein